MPNLKSGWRKQCRKVCNNSSLAESSRVINTKAALAITVRSRQCGIHGAESTPWIKSERRLNQEDRAGDSGVAVAAVPGKQTQEGERGESENWVRMGTSFKLAY